MSSEKYFFTKENLDTYLKEVGKEYRRLNGKGMPAEFVLVGGASVLTVYGFRGMTTDIDVLMHAAATMKEAINNVGDRFGLPEGWLNSDLKKTGSFTFKLFEFSKFYKTFYGILTVRVISGEYLIAMKLRANRWYKNDISDILGILAEHEEKGDSITFDRIDKAVNDLYGGWEDYSDEAVGLIKGILKRGDYRLRYDYYRNEERETREILTEFEEEDPRVVKRSNVNDIVRILRKKQKGE